MKKLFLFLAFAAIVGSASAANLKKTIMIDYFTSNHSTAKYEELVRNRVITGIQNTNRLNVIDVDSESSLKIEAERRTSESAMNEDTSRLGEMKTMGASYILTGVVDNITTERKKLDDGTTYFNATLTFTLKVVNVEDGSVHASKTFTNNGGGSLFGAGSTEEKAILGAISSTEGKMETLVDEQFPLKGTIAEMKESKKGKMISCYIDLGTGHGITNGQYVKVMKIKQIAGRETTDEIGRLKVEVDVAEDLSECKVIKGGDLIYEAFNNGDKLTVITIKQGGIGGGLKTLAY